MAENTKKKYDSQIYVDGKRMSAMKEIAKVKFQDSFLSIGITKTAEKFIIMVNDLVDMKEVEKFEEKYPLCNVEVYKKIRSRPEKAKYVYTPQKT